MIYITLAAFDKSIIEKNRYDLLFKILSCQRQISIFVPSEKISLFIDPNTFDEQELNPSVSFCTGNNISAIPKKEEDLNSFINQPQIELIKLKDPSPIYIVDINSVEITNKIQEEYGIFCINLNNLSDNNVRQLIQTKKISLFARESIKSIRGIKASDTTDFWNCYFTGISPSNSLLINDRYLFCPNSDNNLENMIANIIAIITANLPTSHAENLTYSILITFDHTKTTKNQDILYEEQFKKISTRLHKELSNKRKNLAYKGKIDLELYTYDESALNNDRTHNRRILSNYFIVQAEHSFCAFDTGKNTVIKDQSISLGMIFSLISQNPPIIDSEFERYKEIFIEMINNKNTTHFYSLNGNNNSQLDEIKNKLLS